MDLATAHAVTIVGDTGPTVVLGHGLGGDQRQWAPVVGHLASRCRTVTFDLAGAGACHPSVFSPARHSTVLGFADDLAMVCAELGIRDAVYVGHSMSAMAGALVAAADPGVFRQLVLIGASARYADDPDQGYCGGFSAQAIDELLDAIATDFLLWSGGFAATVMGNPERPQLATEFARTLAGYEPDVALTAFRAAFLGDHRDVVPRVGVPALVLSTTADPAVPVSAARWLAEALPAGELRLLEIDGHFPHVVDPARIITELDAFLTLS
jgi:sigma-B regulation protein RsbQ